MISIVTDTDISHVNLSGRDTEGANPPGPWSAQQPLSIERDGDGRPTESDLSAALVAGAGLLNQQTTSVTLALTVTDGGSLIRTVEYRLTEGTE